MDPIMVIGAWASALASIIMLGRLFYTGFIKATKAVVDEQFNRIWRELDESEKWHAERFSKFEAALEALKAQVQRLEEMMRAHVDER